MAESSFPFDSIDTTENQYTEFFRKLQDTGVWAHTDVNELLVSAATGLDVSLAAGFAIVRGHVYINDATLTLTHDAGDAQARIDSVVLRLDPSADSIIAAIVKGTPAASPAAPALTQTDTGVYEMELARVSIAPSASSISAGNISDRRPFMGSVVGLWSTARRPASPRLGKTGFNTDLGYAEEWDGSTWKPAGLPDTIDADTLNGRNWHFGTSDPSSSFGAVGDIYFKHEA